jgi:hypothetical protein
MENTNSNIIQNQIMDSNNINIYTFSLDTSLEEIHIKPSNVVCDVKSKTNEKQHVNKKTNKPVYSGFYGPPL